MTLPLLARSICTALVLGISTQTIHADGYKAIGTRSTLRDAIKTYHLANDPNIAAPPAISSVAGARSLAASPGQVVAGIDTPGNAMPASAQYLTPQMYHCAGDGVTDDYACLQNLINGAGATGLPIASPCAVYATSQQLKPPVNQSTLRERPTQMIWRGGTGAQVAKGNCVNGQTTIKWIGPTDSHVCEKTDSCNAIFGLKSDESGSIAKSWFQNLRWDCNRKCRHGWEFYMTPTSKGAPRRQLDNVDVVNNTFLGATGAQILIGKDSVTNYAQLIANRDDIAADTWRFPHTEFGGPGSFVKLTGPNIYNMNYCDAMFSADQLAGHRAFIDIGAANIYFCNTQINGHMRATGDAPTTSFFYFSGGDADFDNLTSEEVRLLYCDVGDTKWDFRFDHVKVNDTTSSHIGNYVIYNDSSTSLEVRGSSFFTYAGTTDYCSSLYTAGPQFTWQNSHLTKVGCAFAKMKLTPGVNANINGRALTTSTTLNTNALFSAWSAGLPNDGMKLPDGVTYSGRWNIQNPGGTVGSISKTQSNRRNGTYTAEISCASGCTDFSHNYSFANYSPFLVTSYVGKELISHWWGTIKKGPIGYVTLVPLVRLDRNRWIGGHCIVDVGTAMFDCWAKTPEVKSSNSTIDWQLAMEAPGTIDIQGNALLVHDNDLSYAFAMNWLIDLPAKP